MLPTPRAIVIAILLVVTLSGCAPSGRSARHAAQQARNDAAVDAIRDQLMRAPGVVEAQVTYGTDITNAGSTGVSLIVEEGVGFEQANDFAVRTVWLSQLNPLVAIVVGVGLDEDRTQGIAHDYNRLDDWDELESRYGPRPVSDD